MTIYRGPGGGGNADSDAEINALTALTQQSLAYSEQAGVEADAAALSAAAASTSASDAATSASGAATSETNAAASASSASTSATNAAASASSASTSASNAATSATSASSSASAASTSATNAAASETNAAASSSTASTYATNSAASAVTASTQAGLSATSASAAAGSATNAATSATNAATSASGAATSATAAAASYDSFDDRYLGAKSADPTLDNDGNALLTGALYWNTVSNQMRVYSGSAWVISYLPADGYVQKVGDTMTGTLSLPNMTFTGTGNRITGDFSNATIANRVAFQTSTTNGNTSVGAIPNGTSVSSNFTAFAGTDSSNTSFARMRVDGTSAAAIFESSVNGTGTNLPMTFYTSGSERVRIDTSGNVGIGASSPGTYGKLEVAGSGYTGSSVRSTDASGVQVVLAANSSSEARINVNTNHPLAIYTNGTERARISATGQMSTTNGTGAVALAYDARAWVNFNGTGTVAIRGSGNVSSITDNGTGDYTVNFTTAMPDSNYSCVAIGTDIGSTGQSCVHTNTLAAGSARIHNNYVPNNSGLTLTDLDGINVSIFR